MVNGQRYEFDFGLTLFELLMHLGLGDYKWIVVHNGNVVPDHLDTVVVQDGDDVEILHFVGGGAGVLL